MKTRNLIIIACLLAGCVPPPADTSSGGDGPTVAPAPVKPPLRGPGFYRDLIGPCGLGWIGAPRRTRR
jgi:hypothetical protein